MAKHLETGQLGEEAALLFLKEKGFSILETNWRHSRAEVDIIARDEDILVFLEVKTRRSGLAIPEAAVHLKKQKLLARAATAYMDMINYDWEFRFDVIAIHLKNEQDIRISHLKDAFFPGL